MKKRIVSALIALSIVNCKLSTVSSASAKYTQIVPFKYDYVYDFNEGMAAVMIGKKIGFIDESGKEVVPCIYDMSDSYFQFYPDCSFSEGLMRVCKVEEDGVEELNNVKWGFIDKKGNTVVPLKYNEVGDFSDGMAWVMTYVGEDMKYGYIDKFGNEVVPCIHDSAGDFRDGVAVITKGDWENREYSVIDKQGNTIVPFGKYKSMSVFFNNGIASVGGNKYIDTAGNEFSYKTVDSYDSSYRFTDELVAVALDGKWGFVDNFGVEVVPCKYTELQYRGKMFKELIGVRIGDYGEYNYEGNDYPDSTAKWGFINDKGEEVIPCIYDDFNGFSEGLAAVYRNGKAENGGHTTVFRGGEWGVIDESGKTVVPFGKYGMIYSYSGGLALVSGGYYWDNMEYGIIDKKGGIVIPIGEYSYNYSYYEGGFSRPDWTTGLIAVRDTKTDKWGFLKMNTGYNSGNPNSEVNPKTHAGLPILAAVLSGTVLIIVRKRRNT